MEDRLTPGLYLELTSRTPEDYVEGRLAELAGRPGVRRATWWANARPDRTDLPRTLEEFTLLACYEVRGAFRLPPPAEGVTSLHYVRTSRPGQGALLGRPTTGLLVVLISARENDRTQDLRDWADFVHIRHIAECGVPGFAMITPYEHAERKTPRFLHLYEFATDDPEATFRLMRPRVVERLGGGPGTAAYDAWATHPQLVIDYVNTFGLLGERKP